MYLETMSLQVKQKGAVLAVSLIFLLILTILGVSSMRSTVLEEKMAGNMRDRSLAFQAAEVALRDAEAFIESIVSAGGFVCDVNDIDDPTAITNCTGGFQYANGVIHNDVLECCSSTTNGDVWSTDNGSVAASTDIAGVKTAPRYFIIHNANLVNETQTALNIGPGYGGLSAGDDMTAFTIVARGTGGTDNSQVTIVSYYGKRF